MTHAAANSDWVYLDNNATTRADRRVVDAMLPWLRENFANPSSAYALGAEAAAAIAAARRKVRALLGAARESEIVFTSSGSESNSTAIHSALAVQTGRNEIVTSAVEHKSVLALCAHLEQTGRARVHRIAIDRSGRLDLEAYRASLNERTALAALQWANNETGVIFPVAELATRARHVGALFHCDAVQAAGRVAIDLSKTEIDTLSLSAHKMHGPKGVGALYVRHGVRLAPLIWGGRQERGRRAGTENTAAIVGLGAAAELAANDAQSTMLRVAQLRNRLQNEILRRIPAAMVIGDGSPRLPNTLNVAFEDREADSILLMLDRAHIAVSSGSACTAGSMEPSHVLRAMKIPFSHLRGAVRLSLSRETTTAEIDHVLDVLPAVLRDLEAFAAPREAAYA